MEKRKVLRQRSVDSVKMLAKRQKSMEQQISKIMRKQFDTRTGDEIELLEQNPELVTKVEVKLNKGEEQKDRLKEFEENLDVLREKCAKVAEAIRRSRRLVVYTGAGISTSANIPDYRGPNGVWTLMDQGKDVASCDLGLAQPTTTHMALFMLYKQGKISHIVSQNCDGLHLRSGIPRSKLSEVHGNMFIEVCKGCKPVRPYVRLFDVTERTNRYRHGTKRRCYICGAGLVDTIVHFGERGSMAWPINWNGASKAAEKADMILCLGSSLKVLRRYPWLWCMDRPAKQRPPLYIVNLQWTPKDAAATLKLNGRCDFVMAEVMKCLRLALPDYTPYNDPLLTYVTHLHEREEHTTTRRTLIESRPVGVNQLSMEASVSASGLIKEVRVSNHFTTPKDEFRTLMFEGHQPENILNNLHQPENILNNLQQPENIFNNLSESESRQSEDDTATSTSKDCSETEEKLEDSQEENGDRTTEDEVSNGSTVVNGATFKDFILSAKLSNGSDTLSAKDVTSSAKDVTRSAKNVTKSGRQVKKSAKLSNNGWSSSETDDGSLSDDNTDDTNTDDTYVPPNCKDDTYVPPKSRAGLKLNEVKVKVEPPNCDKISSQPQLSSPSGIRPPDTGVGQLSCPPPSPDHNYAVSPVKTEPETETFKPELKAEPEEKPKCKFNLRQRKGIPIWKTEELIRSSRKAEELLIKKETKPKRVRKPKADPNEIRFIEYRTVEWPKDALYFGYEPHFLFVKDEDDYVCCCCDPAKKRKSPESTSSSDAETVSEEENDDGIEAVFDDDEYDKSSEESPAESNHDSSQLKPMAPGWFGKGRRKKGRSK